MLEVCINSLSEAREIRASNEAIVLESLARNNFSRYVGMDNIATILRNIITGNQTNIFQSLFSIYHIPVEEEIAVLSEESFDKIPKVNFSPMDSSTFNCTICFTDFEPGEELKQLPCGHMFHEDCIKPWLTNNNKSCPTCREDVVDQDGLIRRTQRRVDEVMVD